MSRRREMNNLVTDLVTELAKIDIMRYTDVKVPKKEVYQSILNLWTKLPFAPDRPLGVTFSDGNFRIIFVPHSDVKPEHWLSAMECKQNKAGVDCPEGSNCYSCADKEKDISPISTILFLKCLYYRYEELIASLESNLKVLKSLSKAIQEFIE